MDNAVYDLLHDLYAAGLTIVPNGQHVRYRPKAAMTPDLRARLRQHKAGVLLALAPPCPPAFGDDDDDAIDPTPCPRCGGLTRWWTLTGAERCSTCDPPHTAVRVLEHAERIRKRHGIASPTDAVELLNDLRNATAARPAPHGGRADPEDPGADHPIG